MVAYTKPYKAYTKPQIARYVYGCVDCTGVSNIDLSVFMEVMSTMKHTLFCAFFLKAKSSYT